MFHHNNSFKNLPAKKDFNMQTFLSCLIAFYAKWFYLFANKTINDGNVKV